ncbi:hypothetical protein CVU82_00370 [Candidatus Falkowbacteria bacterium HGW-Falkowbacteria-1]|jgi:glycosyltransferase involved in cell wall biosynthesis|uniref:Glycosyltransferase 2-like domain-containing protein n=1 Tax=Candidatus Falkowbacteria bacterium HGW-Falkowbacteria-1 TaxID=2013768 RepID=A0A2N2EA86_9BACT|nr:MAG: hypothetical protein CVU82_00370 [Candidatus Falkowbacteria bacterium HGW-Falkowbacteria-1]
MKKISVIIPCYNDPNGLKITLESLENQSLSKDLFEVIVGNDGASEDVRNVCNNFGVRFVNVFPRRGISVARNRAIEKSFCNLLAFTDADIVVDKNWLENGIKFLSIYDYVGGVIKTVLNKNKIRNHEYYQYLTSFNNEYNFKKDKYFAGGNIFAKKKVFDKLAGFEEKIIFGGEDREFGVRVFLSKRYRMFYSEEIIVYHPVRTFKELLRKSDIYRESSFFLGKICFDKFPSLKPNIFKFFKLIIIPPIKVLGSKRKINKFVKIKVFFWSFYLGFLDSLNYIKNRIKGKKYYDFFE